VSAATLSDLDPGESAGRSAAQSVRVMALSLGIGTALFFFVSLQAMIAQFDDFPPAWTVVTATAVFGSGVALAATSWIITPRALRVVAAVLATSYLVTMATVLPALGGRLLSADDGIPWPLLVSTVGTAAAAVAWRAPVAWTYFGVIIAVHTIDRAAASHVDLSLVYQNVLLTVLFDVIFTALALSTRTSARRLDTAAAAAIAETRTSATTAGVLRERARVEALLHDNVLVALLTSARGTDPRRAATLAAQAIRRVQAIDSGAEEDSTEIDAATLVWRLQATATELLPDATFAYEGSDPRPIPSEAARAVTDAAAEAMRNSLEHAGADVSRSVHIDAGDPFRVNIIDDGVGFDPASVPETRLGIAISMVARMRAVAGGDARIASAPGVGTRVELTWGRP
jgi:signal transduction histidine kinase